MSSTISQAIDAAAIGAAQAANQADAQMSVKGLFMLFHAWYGNLFLSRYATGEVDANKKDKGIKSAMVAWQVELSRFSDDIVRAAADRCKLDHPKYPPTLPEFAAICRAIEPRRRSQDHPVGIEMSGALRSVHSAQVRAVAMAAYKARLAAQAGVMEVGEGLAGLHLLVARAVALAGGDEAQALRRLETP